MALQGILCGFADPENLAANVILAGRGDKYILVVDGKPAEAHEGIAAARQAFRRLADGHIQPHWRSVSGTRTDVNGYTTVTMTEKGNATFAERYPADLDDAE